MAERAGEIIAEFALALNRKLKLFDIANVIHAYPTYSIGVMQLAGEIAVDDLLAGPLGSVMRGAAKVMP